METKSQMINRIAELAKENAELKQEVKQWKHEYEMLDACIELEQGKIAELKAENERLKRENEIITGMHNSSSNRFDKLYNTLQEIKTIAETAINGGYKTKSSDYSEGMETIGHYIMQKITKAEEE